MKSLLSRTRTKVQHTLQNASSAQPGLRQSNLWVRAVTWSLIGASGFGITWLSVAQTEEIIMVPGKLEPTGQVQELRLPIGGITQEVLVKEGQTVQKGQLLIRLDTRITVERRSALTQGLNLKRQQLDQKQLELDEFVAQNTIEQETLRNRLALQGDIVNRLLKLEISGATSKLQLLQQQNELAETRGSLERSKLERGRQLAILRQSQRELQQQEAELQGQLNEQKLNLDLQEVRAPVNGLVFDLKPTGAGFVAQSNEPVMKLVPMDHLQAKVEIPSRNVGFVRVGQQAEINIDSYPASDFGVIQAKVIRLSSDALPPAPSEGRNEAQFPALLQLSSQQMKLPSSQTLPLQTGMSLQAHIKLRKTSYLQLLLSNLNDKTKSLQRL